MKGDDNLEGLIDAVRNYAPPYGQTAITDTLLLDECLAQINRNIERTLAAIRTEHRSTINNALKRVGAKLDNSRRYERTLHIMIRMDTPAARAALVQLIQLMVLCRMRCTYRIGLSRRLVYAE